MNLFKTSWYRFINQPPLNETQTRWTRFMESPGSEINSMFSRSQKDFEDKLKLPDTRYSKYLEEYDAIF